MHTIDGREKLFFVTGKNGDFKVKLNPDAAKCADFAVEILQFVDDEDKKVPGHGHGHIHTNTQMDNKSKKVTQF